MRAYVSLVGVVALACGCSEGQQIPLEKSARTTPAPSAAPPGAASSASAPRPSAPLAGKIDGAAFTVKSAFAHEDKAFPTTRTLTFYDEERDCLRSGPEGKGARQTYVHVPWPPRGPAAVQVGGVIVDEKVPRGFEIKQGEVEVVGPVPDVGEKGRVRVRVSNAEHGMSLEGETEFVLCEYRAP